jgi:hypothetical protein
MNNLVMNSSRIINEIDSPEIIFISAFYLSDSNMVMNIKRRSKFSTESALIKYKYEVNIQQI